MRLAEGHDQRVRTPSCRAIIPRCAVRDRPAVSTAGRASVQPMRGAVTLCGALRGLCWGRPATLAPGRQRCHGPKHLIMFTYFHHRVGGGTLPGSRAEQTMYGVIDGVIQRAESATISVMDQGFLRGDGAFEVLLVYGGRPFAADQHLDRLQRSCVALRLACPRDLIERDLLSLVETSSRDTYAVRIVLTRAGRRIVLGEPWSPPAKPSRLLVVSNHQQPLLTGVKSLSYAANMLSKRLAREQGFDDALWISADGCILEAQTAAFFWVSSKGELCTPPLSEPILDSITRRRVIEQVDVRERRVPPR